MKNFLYLFFTILFVSVIFTSCEKELLGCMDTNAENYNNLANTDDDPSLEFVTKGDAKSIILYQIN